RRVLFRSIDLDPVATVRLVPGMDTLLAFREGTRLLTAPEHHSEPVRLWGSMPDSTLGEARLILQRAIVSAGRLIGWWEFDPQTRGIAWRTFAPADSALIAAIDDSGEELDAMFDEGPGHERT